MRRYTILAAFLTVVLLAMVLVGCGGNHPKPVKYALHPAMVKCSPYPGAKLVWCFPHPPGASVLETTWRLYEATKDSSEPHQVRLCQLAAAEYTRVTAQADAALRRWRYDNGYGPYHGQSRTADASECGR